MKLRTDARVSKTAGRRAVAELKRELRAEALSEVLAPETTGATDAEEREGMEGGSEDTEKGMKEKGKEKNQIRVKARPKENDQLKVRLKEKVKPKEEVREKFRVEENKPNLGTESEPDVEETENLALDESEDSDQEETHQLLAELAKIKAEKAQHAELQPGPKRGWKKTAFSAHSSQPDRYSTDTLESDHHKQFLSKYFR